MHFRRSLQKIVDWLAKPFGEIISSSVFSCVQNRDCKAIRTRNSGRLKKTFGFERWWTVTHDSWQISVPNYFTMPCIIIIRKKRKLFYRTQGVDFMVGIITMKDFWKFKFHSEPFTHVCPLWDIFFPLLLSLIGHVLVILKCPMLGTR